MAALWAGALRGSRGRAWPLRALSPCQPPPEMGCVAGGGWSEALVREETPRLSGPGRQAPACCWVSECCGFRLVFRPACPWRAAQSRTHTAPLPGGCPRRREQWCCVGSFSQGLLPSPLLPYVSMSWEVLIFPCLNPAVKSLARRCRSEWSSSGTMEDLRLAPAEYFQLFVKGYYVIICLIVVALVSAFHGTGAYCTEE